MKQLRMRVIIPTRETCPVLTNCTVCNIYQTEGKVVSVHDMKTYGWRTVTRLHIQVTGQPHPLRNSPRHSLNRKLDWSQSQSGVMKNKTISWPRQESNPSPQCDHYTDWASPALGEELCPEVAVMFYINIILRLLHVPSGLFSLNRPKNQKAH